MFQLEKACEESLRFSPLEQVVYHTDVGGAISTLEVAYCTYRVKRQNGSNSRNLPVLFYFGGNHLPIHLGRSTRIHL